MERELTLPRFFDTLELYLIEGVSRVRHVPEMSFIEPGNIPLLC
jgi:hypothetical protein